LRLTRNADSVMHYIAITSVPHAPPNSAGSVAALAIVEKTQSRPCFSIKTSVAESCQESGRFRRCDAGSARAFSNRQVKETLFFLLAGIICQTALWAEVRTAAPFGDNMVLQRECVVPVWGTARPGEKVTVSFAGQDKSATTGDDGKWMVKLDPLKACKTPAELRIAGVDDITLKNILVGEVWFCSGQSNMYLGVGTVLDKDREMAAADYPLLRQAWVRNPPDIINSAKQPVTGGNCNWKLCTPQSAVGFSAVAYFFGRELMKELDVPVGLIVSAVGGTRIEPWTNREGFAAVPELKEYIPQVDSWPDESTTTATPGQSTTGTPTADSSPAASLSSPPAFSPTPASHLHPGQLYNALVHPVVPFAIRGVIWYQGENNAGDGPVYFDKMRGIITGWRQVWGQGDFPFYFVHLAYAPVRDAQRRALSIPNTGMAVNIDSSDGRNIHPPNKQDTGKRLALLALAKTYGKAGIACEGPLYKEYKIEGNRIRLSFDHVSGGMMWGQKKDLEPVSEIKSDSSNNFQIAGEDRKFVVAEAKIEGDCVVISSPQVSTPVAVRYPASGRIFLYNRDFLPAGPFRTDQW